MGKYFGTDGIRGVANTELDAHLAYRAGVAAAYVLTRAAGHRAVFYIGRDTRISGDMLECALAAGLCAAGADVISLGVLPTPAVALLTARHNVDAGVVISASHNPFEHNGIKIFGSEGYKLTDEQEALIEQYIDAPPHDALRVGGDIGRVTHLESRSAQEYIDHIVSSAPCSLSGVRVLADCANGAASATAREVFAQLGADAHIICDEPNGVNINVGCGSTHLDRLCALMRDGDYDVGVAFDGDADRCLLVDETGEPIHGDRVIGVLAHAMQQRNRLAGGVVATVVSNLGLRVFCEQHGMGFAATKVGDRYVLEEMRRSGCNVGGEQSGHVILSDYATTGDGQLTAIHALALMRESGKKASELFAAVPIYPQTTINVPVPNAVKASVTELESVKSVIAQISEVFGTRGRILIRPSGTEALVRVMVEGEDMEAVSHWASIAAEAIRAAV